jgi:hypothetical protein
LKSAEYRFRLPVICIRPSQEQTELNPLSEFPGPPHSYKNSAAVKKRLKEIVPGVLYELLDAMRVALANLGSVLPVPEFSLAGFSQLAQAAAPAFGWSAEEIGGLLSAHVGQQRAVVAANSPIVVAMLDWLAEERAQEGTLRFEIGDRVCWTGTLSTLLDKLNSVQPTGRWSKGWPVDAAALSRELQRLSKVLAACGLAVEKVPRGRGQWGRRVQIRWLPDEADRAWPDQEKTDDEAAEDDWKPAPDALH